jgi:hypothetical protein
MRRRQQLQILQRVSRDESQASALGDSGAAAQSSTENEKNAQVEMQNGTKPVSTDDIKAEFDGLVNAEMGLIDGSSSSVADPLPPRASVSSGGDAHIIMTSPSENDALVNKSNSSNLVQGSKITT